jgi:hypothetical protein
LKPFTDAGFVKECILKATETLYLEKQQPFETVILSQNTLADRVNDLVGDIQSQLKNVKIL